MRTVICDVDRDVTDMVGQFAPDLPTTPSLRVARSETGVLVTTSNGAPLLAVGRMPDSLTNDLHRVLPRVAYTTTLRSGSGYSNRSAVFGWKTPKPVQRRESCTAAVIMQDRPTAAVLLAAADHCRDFLASNLPAVVQHDLDVLRPVDPQWRMTSSSADLWTSGVINHTSTMPYHYDSTNFPTWSAMPVVRHHVSGGHLHMPALDLVVPCNDGTCLYWWGQRILHGVTPMHARAADGYRFTVVYYALRGMVDCATHAMEVARGNARRTLTEERVAQGTSPAMTRRLRS